MSATPNQAKSNKQPYVRKEQSVTLVQEKFLELLLEIDAICRKENIQYSLFGKTVWQVYREHTLSPKAFDVHVAMRPKACRIFMEAVKREGRGDRFLDSLENNPDYPSLEVRYGNRNTLDFPLDNRIGISSYGLHIKIVILRVHSKRKLYSAVRKVLESGWEVCHSFAPRPLEARNAFLVKLLCALFGKARVARFIFNYSMPKASTVTLSPMDEPQAANLPASDDKNAVSGKPQTKPKRRRSKLKYYTKNFLGRYINYPERWFSQTKEIELEGHLFPIPSSTKAYLDGSHKNWLTTEPFKDPNPAKRIIDPEMPFSDYLEMIQRNGQLDAWRKLKRHLTRKSAPVTAMNKKILAYWGKLVSTCMRYSLWTTYMPQKEALLTMHAERRKGDLREAMAPYISALDESYKTQQVVCFDKELYELAEKLLSKKGYSKKRLKEMRKRIPESHWKDICLPDSAFKK